MSDRLPLVSVIIPAFNAETTIARTLKSVCEQTYRNLEILIVDDGSTDGTRELCEQFVATEPRATLLKQANAGVALARNLAMARAKGEWIAPVDADDLWHPTKIEKQIATALSSAPKPGFVYCWCRHIDYADRVISSGPRFFIEGSGFRQFLYLNAVRNGSSLLLARDAALSVGGYDASLRAADAQGCEDVMIQLQLAQAFPVACVPEYLTGYRVSGLMSGDDRQIRKSWQLVYSRMAKATAGEHRRIFRRVRGRAAFDEAQTKVAHGRYAAAVSPMTRALALDPVRSSLLLIDRIMAHLFQVLPDRRQAATPDFFTIDPTVPLPTGVPSTRGPSALVEKLERRRLRALAN